MFRSTIQRLYDATIRDYLPRKIKVYNGVALRIGRLLDTNVVDPEYKQGTIGPLRVYSRHDDRITVIGGGLGVSAVVAAHNAESVIVYEGGREWVTQVQETAELNRVSDSIQIHEAIVAEDHDVYGDTITDNLVSPDHLDPCDVLEMDCEGAEETILRGLEIEPRVIIVETHPGFGVEPASVRQLLEGRGYEIANRYELVSGNVTYTGVQSCVSGST